MARDFVRSSSHYLEHASSLNISAYPVFFACRVNTDQVTNNLALMSLAASATSNNFLQLNLRGDTGDIFEINRRNTTISFALNGPVTAVIGTWHHVFVSMPASNSVAIYVDSLVGPGTDTANVVWPTGVDRFRVGLSARSTSDNPFDGKMAEVAVGIASPTVGEIAAFMAGWSPDTIWPSASIAGYWRLLGNDSPEPEHFGSGLNLTVATPTKSGHPPGLAYKRRVMVSFGGAVTTGISPASDDLVLSTTAPALLIGVHPNLLPAQDNLVLSGTAPTVSRGTTANISPAAANLVISKTAPVLGVPAEPTTPPDVSDLEDLVGQLRLQDKEDIWRKNLMEVLEAVVSQFTTSEVTGSFFLLENGDRLELESGTDVLLLD